MSKAYKCDRCREYFNGDPAMKIKTNKIILAINYCPDGNEPCWYPHDLCDKDADAFVEWFNQKGEAV